MNGGKHEQGGDEDQEHAVHGFWEMLDASRLGRDG
jgi:hypothetical protein